MGGMRYRTYITPDTTTTEALQKARKVFQLDQDFLAESDFKVYLKEDESKPITGKISEHTKLRPWGPEGIELHMYYEPAAPPPPPPPRRKSPPHLNYSCGEAWPEP